MAKTKAKKGSGAGGGKAGRQAGSVSHCSTCGKEGTKRLHGGKCLAGK